MSEQSSNDPLGPDAPLDTDDVVELLGEEEPKEELDLTPPKALDKEKGEEEEPEDELKELEEELEGPSEEDLELMTPVRRKEILAKYPQLFKDFPYLEKAYYRDQQFTELLPTIGDAKIAVEKATILDQFEQHVVNGGNIEVVLRAAKEDNPEAFNRIADNYLPSLRQVDQQAYYHVLGNVIKDTILTMVREGRALGEQGAPLQAAANILNQFVFGSQNFTPPTTLARQVKPEEANAQQEIAWQQQQMFSQQFQGVVNDLQTRANNVLKATIDGHIDPRSSMTDYVKKNASKDAMDTLEDLMGRDARFRGLLDRLWEKSYERGFDKESTDKIKSAYLSKAKTLLPSVIKKARNDALRGHASSSDVPSERKGLITPGRSTSNSGGKISKPSDIPRGMKTIDFLMKD